MQNTTTKNTTENTTRRMVTIALITAITCILAPLSVPIPISPVPITLTNLVLFISVFVMEWKDALLSYVIYLLIGLAGLPVFSGFSGGLAKIAGPTGGYLIGFVFLILIAGIIIHKAPRQKLPAVIGMTLGMAVTYLFGTVWLAVQMELSFTAALSAGVLPYLPGDIIKIIIASIAGPILQNRLVSIR